MIISTGKDTVLRNPYAYCNQNAKLNKPRSDNSQMYLCKILGRKQNNPQQSREWGLWKPHQHMSYRSVLDMPDLPSLRRKRHVNSIRHPKAIAISPGENYLDYKIKKNANTCTKGKLYHQELYLAETQPIIHHKWIENFQRPVDEHPLTHMIFQQLSSLLQFQCLHTFILVHEKGAEYI